MQVVEAECKHSHLVLGSKTLDSRLYEKNPNGRYNEVLPGPVLL